MARNRRTATAAATPHRPHRGGGADADHGISRGPLDPRHARRRGIARRYPLLLALFRKRPRQQRRARLQADRGHQFGRRQRQTGAEEAASAGEGPGEDGEEVRGRVANSTPALAGPSLFATPYSPFANL